MTLLLRGLMKIVCLADTMTEPLRRGESVTGRCKGKGDKGKGPPER